MKSFPLNYLLLFSRDMFHLYYVLYWKSYLCYVQLRTFLQCGLFFFGSFCYIFQDLSLPYKMRKMSHSTLVIIYQVYKRLGGPLDFTNKRFEIHASFFTDVHLKIKDDIPNGTASISPSKVEATSLSSGSTTALAVGIPSYLFAEKLVPLLVDLFLQTPEIEKYIIFPELIQSLGRY